MAMPNQTSRSPVPARYCFFIQVSSNSESRTCMAVAASPSSHSSFREEVFSRCSRLAQSRRVWARRQSAVATSRMRWTGQIFWLLAYGPASAGRTFFPPSPPKTPGTGPLGSRIQLQQRNCSRFSRDFLRRSTFPSSQRTGTSTSRLRLERQDYLINCNSCCHVER